MSKPVQITIVISTIFISIVLALLIAVTSVSFDFFIADITGHPYYTEEEYKNGIEDAKNGAFKEKEEYEKLLQQYRDEVFKANKDILDLNSQIAELTNSNADLVVQKDNAIRDKLSAENEVSNLRTQIANNEKVIAENEEKISSYKEQISSLENEKESNKATIESLQNKISGLEILNEQLKSTNTSNASVISSLTAQIISLNSQISLLQSQIFDNQNVVNSLNDKISKLEESIKYYENYISDLENEEKFVATFEYDGSIYKVQVVDKNGFASVDNPVSTDYLIFNYWEVDGSQVDVSSYGITKNTRFIANLTYKYDVKFMNEDSEVESQIVEKGHFATTPSSQIQKDGFQFEGWSVDGVNVVTVSEHVINQNTVFVAKFTRLFVVKFIVDGDEKSVQYLTAGKFATPYSVNNTTYKKFNGWKVGDVFVSDVSSYKIFEDVNFVADFIESFDVEFKVDNSQIDTKIVEDNSFVTDVPVASKDGFKFLGWSKDGINIVDINQEVIKNKTTFIAVMISDEDIINALPIHTSFTSKLNICLKYCSLEEKVLLATGGETISDSVVDNYYLFEICWVDDVVSAESFKNVISHGFLNVKYNVFERFNEEGLSSSSFTRLHSMSSGRLIFVDIPEPRLNSKGNLYKIQVKILFVFDDGHIERSFLCLAYDKDKITLDGGVYCAVCAFVFGDNFGAPSSFVLYGENVTLKYYGNIF